MNDEIRVLHEVQRYKDGWDESRASLKAGDVLPGGLMIVPVEPTTKMLAAAGKAMSPELRPSPEYMSVRQKHRTRYKAMLSAAKDTSHET